MTEKPKKSKHRIPQWLFLVAWIGGQFGIFFGIGAIVSLLTALLNAAGLMLPLPLLYFIGGTGLGWFSGWVQQWSIRKHFGHDIKGWRSISALLTGIVFSLIIPFITDLAMTQPFLFENTSTYTALVTATFMAIFGAAGIGQAILLDKHVKHSWLFFLSTLVGALIYALPLLGDSSYFVAQIAQYAVTAFAILWLFGMSGTMNALQSQDEVIQRLTDSDSEEDFYDEDDEQQRGRVNFWIQLFGRLRLVH